MAENKNFPGRPNYTGPNKGLAGYVHHNERFAYCWDFQERLKAIDQKPANEIATRRHCLVYLDPTGQPWADAFQRWTALDGEFKAKWAALNAEYQQRRDVIYAEYQPRWDAIDNAEFQQRWDALNAEYKPRRAALDAEVAKYAPQIAAQIQALVPNAPWNGKELVFPEEVS